MINKIRLKTKSKNYNITIGNSLFKKFLESQAKSSNKTFLLIDNIIYIKFKKEIKKNKNLITINVNGSEKIKNINFYWKILSILFKNKIDRSSLLVAVGGGTVGDLAGFIASTALRGIKYILVPTTLLAQVDSSIGGKNGINSKFGKNLIGTFYHPEKVIIDISFLKTLPIRQIKSGYAEVVKHALINDKYFYYWLKKNYKGIFNLNTKKLIYAIKKSIKIKSKFISKDEKELLKSSLSRSMLNYGHTFGHALESMNKYNRTLTHGEAISIGMIISAKISYKKNYITKRKLEDIIEHFKNAKLPVTSKLIKKDLFYKKIMNDKKNFNEKINIVLLKDLGKSYFARNHSIDDIKKLVLGI